MQHARTLADVLIEPPPDRQQETVQRNMILQIGMPHCSEIDLVEFRQSLERVVRHHLTVLEVIVRPPRKLREFQRGSEPILGRTDNLQPFLNHIHSDPVSSNDCDIASRHTSAPLVLRIAAAPPLFRRRYVPRLLSVPMYATPRQEDDVPSMDAPPPTERTSGAMSLRPRIARGSGRR